MNALEMMGTRLALLLALAALTAAAAAGGGSGSLDSVKLPIKMKARRSSSGLFDMENNDDGWHWLPRQTRVIANLTGPGEQK